MEIYAFNIFRGRGGSGGVGFTDQSQLYDEKAQRGFNDRPYREPTDVESFPNETAVDDAPRGEDYGYGDEVRGSDYRARTTRGKTQYGYGGKTGRGFYSGPGGGRGAMGHRGRQFERISGSDKTGVKAIDKREGGGKFNWGGPADELAGENEALATAREELPVETEGGGEEKTE